MIKEPGRSSLARVTALAAFVAAAACGGSNGTQTGLEGDGSADATGGSSNGVGGSSSGGTTCALYGQLCNASTPCCSAAIPCFGGRCLSP